MHSRPNRVAALAVLTMSAALAGCSSVDFDAHEWFLRPADFFGHNAGGYSYSELKETQQLRPITPNDLVNTDGSCPAPPPMPAPPAQTAPGVAPDAAAAASPDASSLLGSGVALGMSECDVVYRAGQPTSVQLGQTSYGARSAVLTFQSGPRPGIYRFEGGRLMEMDRVAETPPPVATTKKPAKAKKHPAKSKDAA